MRKKLREKIVEALSAVLPITIIVLILAFTLTPMSTGTLMLFVLGAVLLIFGMGFFTLGADVAMMPMGDAIGHKLSVTKSLVITAIICFLIGVFVTIAEPDLQVLAGQIPSIPSSVMIMTVAFGVGVFLLFAALRIRLNIPLRPVLLVFYAIVFILAIFVPSDFWAVAFDGGGVTTGPITVPFILALGAGFAVLTGKDEDSFGVVAMCSVGPIISVMILGLVYDTSTVTYTETVMPEVLSTRDAGMLFIESLPEYLEEVALGLTPVLIFFIVFQIVSLRLNRRTLIRIGVGVIYTFVGLVLFLLGANIGFMPVGNLLGATLAIDAPWWVLVLIGCIVGYFIVRAEPAVHVLTEQVENITAGAISQRSISAALSIAVAASVGIAMLRVEFGISIMYFLIPGYAIAIILMFFVPKIFTAVAFDSGGVASGPMTATFLLPLAMGACSALGGNIMTDAFGVVAMVAMMPLVTVQIMGLVYQIKLNRTAASTIVSAAIPEFDDDIVDYSDDIDDAEDDSHGN